MAARNTAPNEAEVRNDPRVAELINRGFELYRLNQQIRLQNQETGDFYYQEAVQKPDGVIVSNREACVQKCHLCDTGSMIRVHLVCPGLRPEHDGTACQRNGYRVSVCASEACLHFIEQLFNLQCPVCSDTCCCRSSVGVNKWAHKHGTGEFCPCRRKRRAEDFRGIIPCNIGPTVEFDRSQQLELGDQGEGPDGRGDEQAVPHGGEIDRLHEILNEFRERLEANDHNICVLNQQIARHGQRLEILEFHNRLNQVAEVNMQLHEVPQMLDRIYTAEADGNFGGFRINHWCLLKAIRIVRLMRQVMQQDDNYQHRPEVTAGPTQLKEKIAEFLRELLLGSHMEDVEDRAKAMVLQNIILPNGTRLSQFMREAILLEREIRSGIPQDRRPLPALENWPWAQISEAIVDDDEDVMLDLGGNPLGDGYQ